MRCSPEIFIGSFESNQPALLARRPAPDFPLAACFLGNPKAPPPCCYWLLFEDGPAHRLFSLLDG